MPNLTSKELDAISDELTYDQVLIKKYKNYATMTNDPKIKSTCEQIAAQHQNHFNILMGHLN